MPCGKRVVAMASEIHPLDRIVPLANALEAKGFQPILIGGMALVVLGSRRITADFDFLVSAQAVPPDLVEAFYREGFELVTKFDPEGGVKRTIDNPRVAAARMNMDKPPSAFFYDWKTGLKIDLLFDFPLPACELADRSARIDTASGFVRVASPEDLLRLKEIAYADRKSAADAQDLEFLRRLLKTRKERRRR